MSARPPAPAAWTSSGEANPTNPSFAYIRLQNIPGPTPTPDIRASSWITSLITSHESPAPRPPDLLRPPAPSQSGTGLALARPSWSCSKHRSLAHRGQRRSPQGTRRRDRVISTETWLRGPRFQTGHHLLRIGRTETRLTINGFGIARQQGKARPPLIPRLPRRGSPIPSRSSPPACRIPSPC